MESNGTVPGISILVVDDSEAVRDTVSVILSVCGYQCESAKNWLDAMERVRQSRFDAVVTDLEMPEMDGIALTREIRQQFSSLPVMVMTGHSDEEYRESAFRAGAKEFLSKPFDIPDLIKKLHGMLPGHKEQVVSERA